MDENYSKHSPLNQQAMNEVWKEAWLKADGLGSYRFALCHKTNFDRILEFIKAGLKFKTVDSDGTLYFEHE
jgi:hypothetical protein